MGRPKHEGDWKCSKEGCTKTFKHKQSLNNHIKLCGTGKIISCKLCLKTFCRDWYLKDHKCKGKPLSKHICNVCGKEFKTSYHLNRHLPVHNESTATSYTCSTCSKKYVRKKQFDIHIKNCVSTKKRRKLHENDDIEMVTYFNANDFDDSFIPTFVDLDRVEPSDAPSESVGSMEPFDIDEYDSPIISSSTSTINTTALPIQTTPKAKRFQRQSSNDDASLLLSPSLDLNSHLPDFNSTPNHPIMSSPVNSHSNTSTNNTNELLRTPSGKNSTPQMAMTPNTRQRKSRLAEKHTDFVNSWSLNDKNDIVDVLILSAKNMELYNTLLKVIENKRDSTSKRGRPMTAYSTRKLVWEYYHEIATPSTLTSRPAYLKVSERCKIQVGLDFVDTTTIVLKRKKQFFENNWMMLHKTYQEIYTSYIQQHPMNRVCTGTFFSLKPFYIRTETEKDIEMCCCKLHLHARWAIEGIVNSASEQNIDLPFTDYSSFFDFLTKNCNSSSTTYIPWTCTPSNKKMCDEIKTVWAQLSQCLRKSSSEEVVVNFTTFQSVEYTTKKGEVSKKLKAVTKKATMDDILTFMEMNLAKIINHRNHLKHYRNSVKSFRDSFDALFMDIDFSENLKLPVRYEPQSMHWCYETITVHSGILKLHGEKSYHPIVTDCNKHDQPCVRLVIEKMVDTVQDLPEMLIIESDNCSSQYKSAQHFDDIQAIANKIGIPIIRLFSIAGHGKGEVDHVGGLAKCAIRRYVGTGSFVLNANDALKFLTDKFGDNINPNYIIQEITVEELSDARAAARLKQYPTVVGSDNFQVLVFEPNSTTFKAAPQLCICDDCISKEYGSCPLFSSYELRTVELKKICLRSEVVEVNVEVDVEVNKNHQLDFVLPDTYCAVAADKSSPETLWFIKVKKMHDACDQANTDEWGITIPPGQQFIEGTFVEKHSSCSNGVIYKPNKKKTFFYPESVVYPFVQFKSNKGGLLLTNEEYVEILNYVERSGFTHI